MLESEQDVINASPSYYMIRRLVEGLRYIPDSDDEPASSLLELDVSHVTQMPGPLGIRPVLEHVLLEICPMLQGEIQVVSKSIIRVNRYAILI